MSLKVSAPRWPLAFVLVSLLGALWLLPSAATAEEEMTAPGVACAAPPSPPVLAQEEAQIAARVAQLDRDLQDRSAGTTREERQQLLRERNRLESRRALLARQRALAQGGQCVADLLPDATARAEQLRLIERIEALQAEAAGVSRRGPVALLLSFAIPTVVLGLATLIKWSVDASVNDSADDGVIAHDRRVNRALGISVAPLAAGTIAGAVWLGMRQAERRRILQRTVPLKQERRRVEAMIAPALGPTSWGVSLRAQF